MLVGVRASRPCSELVKTLERIPEIEEFHSVAGQLSFILKLRAAGTEFVIEPYQRFAGEPGEQWTMFLLDPAGNALEFKAFADRSQLFAR